MRLHRSHVSTIALAVVLALVLAACGGGSGESDTPLGTSTLTDREGTLIPTATPYARLPEPTIVSGVAAGAPSTEITYVVEPGDSLSAIADHYDTTVEEIAALNGIEDITQIFVGQELLIPGGALAAAPSAPSDDSASTDDSSSADSSADDSSADDTTSDSGGTDGGDTGSVQTYEVQPGDTALDIAYAFDVTIDDLAAANGTTVEGLNDLVAGQILNIPS